VAVGTDFTKLKETLRGLKLHTVCEEARCPNIGECWSSSSKSEDGGEDEKTATATIMIMGDECTRGCRFCAVKTSRTPKPLDADEPTNVAEALAKWTWLDYVVLTSVDRDDLVDGGSSHFANVIKCVLEKRKNLLVEALTGDFQGNLKLVEQVATSGLHVYAHNLETVERLTPFVRDRRAGYRQSLSVLEHVRSLIDTNKHGSLQLTKSSVMLGCGETHDEIRQTLRDLRIAGVEAVTLGQYMRPTKRHMAVVEYVHPDEFGQWREDAEEMGFRYVASGPLVRSSYRAGEFYLKSLLKSRDGAQRIFGL